MNPMQVSNMFMQMQPDPQERQQNSLRELETVAKIETLKADRVDRSRKLKIDEAEAGKSFMEMAAQMPETPAMYPGWRQSLENFGQVAGIDTSEVPRDYDEAFVAEAHKHLDPIVESIGGYDFIRQGRGKDTKYTQVRAPSSPKPVEVFDPTSPSGVRLMSPDQAVGQPGRPATTRDPSLKEIYDPESPTGTTFVSTADAIGQPGKPSSKGLVITGYDDQGRPLIEMGGSGMGAAAKNRVQGDILGAGETLSALTSIRSRFRPEFQTLGKRLGVALDRMRDRLNPESLTDAERTEMQGFAQYRSEAAQLFSNTLKELSGAAVTPHEMKRAEAWLPNPGTGVFDGDSPAELQAKIDRFEDFTRKALAKSAFIERHGLTVNDISLDEIPRAMQKRGDELMTRYRRQGVSEGEAKRAVKMRLADEFGLAVY